MTPALGMERAESMRTHVEFRSSKFPAYEEEAEQVNPGRHGKRLAEYLRIQLLAQGVVTDEPYAEDWGWALPIKNERFTQWIGCGNYDEYPDGFLCFVEPSKPRIRKWFMSIDTTPETEKVANALDHVLSRDPGVYGLRWWSETEAGV
jgi:hypothetical protein